MTTPQKGRSVVDDRAREARLVEGLREGDEATVAALVAAHHDAMLRIARMYVRTRASAEEVVQETWLAALRGAGRFEGRSSLKTWLFQILVNLARTRGKRDARQLSFSELASAEASAREPAVDPGRFQDINGEQPGHWGAQGPGAWAAPPDRKVLREELRGELQDAIAGLPETQRLVITLRDVEGWSAREVCNALDLSETHQRVLLHRARTKARRALNEYLRGDPA